MGRTGKAACLPCRPPLRRLSIAAPELAGGLPAIEAGALPRLSHLFVDFSVAPGGPDVAPPELPPSWGASPDVLPSLQSLVLNVPRLRGPLPAAWARGFPRLEILGVSYRPPSAPNQLAAGAHPRAPTNATLEQQSICAQGELRALPAEWASGFPRLSKLQLSTLCLAGTVPRAWWDGGFGQLAELSLSGNALTGTLPAHLFRAHPRLRRLVVSRVAERRSVADGHTLPRLPLPRHTTTAALCPPSPPLQLDNNLFEGSLPDAWAESSVSPLSDGGCHWMGR